jgi:hypothetical protein
LSFGKEKVQLNVIEKNSVRRETLKFHLLKVRIDRIIPYPVYHKLVSYTGAIHSPCFFQLSFLALGDIRRTDVRAINRILTA